MVVLVLDLVSDKITIEKSKKFKDVFYLGVEGQHVQIAFKKEQLVRLGKVAEAMKE